MKNKFYDLDHILNIQKWEELQDQLALVTKMAIITVDYKGVPITKHSLCCPFCQSVRTDPQLGKYCQICDSRAGLEAVRSQKPYIYLCHFNIIDVAIPITVDDKYIGAVMVGQIKLADDTPLETFERLLSSQKNQKTIRHLEEHQVEYDMIPTLTFSEVQRYVQMLFYLSNYIVETTLNKNRIIQAYEYFYQEASNRNEGRPAPGLNQSESVGAFYKIRKPAPPVHGSSVLEPAFQYIAENIGSAITQKQLAEICHLSPSYFSRLFTKETGENFSQYLAKKKIEAGRQILENSDCPVAQISDELGFSSPGYFIKVFKRFEGITPFMYRKYYQEAEKTT